MTFKRGHRTHSFDQPAGRPYPHLVDAGGGSSAGGDAALLERYRALSHVVAEPERRARLLGVRPQTEAAWRAGAQLPMLRARRRRLESLLRARG